MCYDESDEVYAKVFQEGEDILTETHKLGIYRTKPQAYRKEIIRLTTAKHGEVKATESPVYGLVSAPGFSWANVELLHNPPEDELAALSIKNTGPGTSVLENSQLHVQVQDDCITSLIHRSTGCEVVAKGCKANQFVIFDDKPLFRQAWDVEVYHLNFHKKLPSVNSTIAEDTPYRVAVVTETMISEQSYLKSTISLSPAIEGQQYYVEFNTEVEWHKAMKLLKVEFPMSVTNKEAAYETQFGLVTRPTHYNTTWDMAKFEVCCHKWADLSEYNFGDSVLNDSKYGFATCGKVMRLSLLRAPKAPDGAADMGHHSIGYALFPHEGNLSHVTVQAAFNFKYPLNVFYATEEASKKLLMQTPIRLTGSPSLILNRIKRGAT